MNGWGEYAPDIAETNASVSPNIVNVEAFPDPEVGVAYGPLPSLAVPASAAALPSAPKGGVSVVARNGNYTTFLFTAGTLYRVATDFTLTSIGTGYSLPDGDWWGRMAFGNFLLVTNRVDGLKQYNVESGGAVSSVSGAPVARVLFPCFDTVMAGDCDGDNRLLRNSAINDHTNWVDDGAGYQVMPDGEEIVGGRELSAGLGVLFQRDAIRAMNRVSDGRIYTMTLMAGGVGAVNPDSICGISGAAFAIDTDGPIMVTGEGIKPIGEAKVARSFIEKLGSNGLNTVQGAVDPSRSRVRWRYRRFDCVSDTVFNNCLDYYWRQDRFVEVEEQTAMVLTYGSSGYDMDSMDTLFPDMDAITIDMDSRFWFGGEPRLGGVNADYKLGSFDGASLAATLESGTIALPTSLTLRSLKPVGNSQNAQIYIKRRDALFTGGDYKGPFGIQASGLSRVRARGKNISAKKVIPAGEAWTFDRGIDDIEGTEGGPRG